ncbi:hypothetical protein [Vibrio neptunius]|uniref:Peptidase C80 domain-containing protein n=3 Tax=Vibrio TaxID=662 RepID=A0ABS3A0R0_9VIBR|nr:hypothetical protein [Vibrio neptunius]MBN3493078.1 hypothetical protein [Vibrio neptunius]MBN3515574.1 hypothetical protein [Vibrio neptunius]MBN3549610.1 hypothetical protein [Vibrio neptunius]MBN3577789.1 hypothetical protein [Vibrio neptunius]MCH9871453.1 hypothetical protein [Vibrio neptunius]
MTDRIIPTQTGELLKVNFSHQPLTVSTYNAVTGQYETNEEYSQLLAAASHVDRADGQIMTHTDTLLSMNVNVDSDGNKVASFVYRSGVGLSGRELVIRSFRMENGRAIPIADAVTLHQSKTAQWRQLIDAGQPTAIREPNGIYVMYDALDKGKVKASSRRYWVIQTQPEQFESVIKMPHRVKDVRVLSHGGARHVWSLDKYGTVAVTVIDADNKLDLAASRAMTAFFTKADVKYVAIHTAEDGSGFALDTHGYLHVFEQKNGVSGYYRSANPIEAFTQLGEFNTGRLTVNRGQVLLQLYDEQGAALPVLSADISGVRQSGTFDLLTGTVTVGDSAYLVRDGVLFQYNKENGWFQTKYTDVSELSLSPTGKAVAVFGADQVLTISESADGNVIQAEPVSIAAGTIQTVVQNSRATYVLGSDGVIRTLGGLEGSITLRGLTTPSGEPETLRSLSVVDNLGVGVTESGAVVKFNLPESGGSHEVAPQTLTLQGENQADVLKVFRDNDDRLIVWQQDSDHKQTFGVLNPSTGAVQSLVSADYRGVFPGGDIERNGIITAGDKRQYCLLNGQVMYYSFIQNEWMPTPTKGIRQLKLGADGAIYALNDQRELVRLNQYGFVESTLETEVEDGLLRTLTKSVQLPEGVQQFAVSATGTIWYVDQDGQLQSASVKEEDLGSVSLGIQRAEGERELQPISVSPTEVFDAYGEAISEIKKAVTAPDGTQWLLDSNGQVYRKLEGSSEWSPLVEVDPAGADFSVLADGRVAIKASDDSLHIYDTRWKTVVEPSTLSLPKAGIASQSLTIHNDGSLWLLDSSAGEVQVYQPKGQSWATKAIPRGVEFQRLMTLQDGSVAGRATDGKVYRYQGTDGWLEYTTAQGKPEFDLLYDQLNYSRLESSYSGLLFSSGEKAHKKPNQLTGAQRLEVPSKQRDPSLKQRFTSWFKAHLKPSTTRGKFHHQINNAHKELASAWSLLNQPSDTKLGDGQPEREALFTGSKTLIQDEQAKILERINKQIGLLDRTGQLNTSFEHTSVFRQIQAFFGGDKHLSDKNLVKRLYDRQVALLGAEDSVAETLKMMLDHKVYLPAGSGDLSALTAQLVNNQSTLLLMQQKTTAGDTSTDSLAQLTETLTDLETKRQESSINKLFKNNFDSLNQADRFYRTFDYLIAGMKDGDHKLQRALNRQGAVQGDVVEQYTRLLQSMSVGDNVDLKAAWGLKAGISHGGNLAENPFESLFTAGITGSVGAGGGNDYKLSFEKTATGVKIKVGHVNKGNVSLSVGLAAGGGAKVGKGYAMASASLTATDKVEYNVENVATFSIDQDDDGKLQRVLRGLLSGSMTPDQLLADADKGDVSHKQGLKHDLDVVGAAGLGVGVGVTNPDYKDTGLKTGYGFSLSIPSIKVTGNVFKHEVSAETKFSSTGGYSHGVSEKIGLFNSLGIEASVGANPGSFKLQGYDQPELLRNNEYDTHMRTNYSPLSAGTLGYTLKKNWDRGGVQLYPDNQKLHPRDGFKFEYTEEGLSKVTWDLTINRTGTLMGLSKVKELLDRVPALKVQLEKLTSFTTPENRDALATKLARLEGSHPALKPEIDALKQLAAFTSPDDKKQFEKQLKSLGEANPHLSRDIQELKAHLGSSLFVQKNKPIKVAMQFTAQAMHQVSNYDPKTDGDYVTFVNKLAMDGANFEITGFSVNEAHSYKTSGGLNALLLNFDSSAELSLSRNTADIKLFYSDTERYWYKLKDQFKALANYQNADVTPEEFSAELKKEYDALLENMERGLGFDDGLNPDIAEQKALLDSVLSLLKPDLGAYSQAYAEAYQAQYAAQHNVSPEQALIALKEVAKDELDSEVIEDRAEVVKQYLQTANEHLDSIRALDSTPRPSQLAPVFTYSGSRLTQTEMTSGLNLSGFNSAVHDGANSVLLTLSNRFGTPDAISNSQGAEASVKSLLADLYANNGPVTTFDVDNLIAQFNRSTKEGASRSLTAANIAEIRRLFHLSGSGETGTADEFAALRSQLENSVQADALAKAFDPMVERHLLATEELVTSDIWQLFEPEGALANSQTINVWNGQLVYISEQAGKQKIVRLSKAQIRQVVRADSERVLQAMSDGYTGTLLLRETALSQGDIESLQALPDQTPSLRRQTGVSSERYRGLAIVGLMEAYARGDVISSEFDPAQRFILSEFFADANGDLDLAALRKTVNNPVDFAKFKDGITRLRAGYAESANVSQLNGAQLVEKLVSWEGLLQSGAVGLSQVVDKQAKGVNAQLHFAPQSMYVGNTDTQGKCAGLGQAYLYALSQGDDAGFKNTFLDGVFTHSDIVRNSATDGTVSQKEAEQTLAFTQALDQLQTDSANGQGRLLVGEGKQSLNQVIHRLGQNSGDSFYQLNTGNHALVLAKKTIAGKASYFFYDPNFADVVVTSQNSVNSADALGKIVKAHLQQAGDGWQGTLADYYAADKAGNGELQFELYRFEPHQAESNASLQQLKTLLSEGHYLTEYQRLRQMADIDLAGLKVSPALLYQMGASIDGRRLSADMDLSASDLISKLSYSGRDLVEFMATQAKQPVAETALKLLKTQLKTTDVDSLLQAGLDVDVARNVLQLVDSHVNSSLEVQLDTWSKLSELAPSIEGAIPSHLANDSANVQDMFGYLGHESEVAKWRAYNRQQLLTAEPVSLGGTELSAVLLHDMGATIEGKPVTMPLLAQLETGGTVAMQFDPTRFAYVLSQIPAQPELEKIASLVKKQLEMHGGDVSQLLGDGVASDAPAAQFVETLRQSPTASLEIEVAKQAVNLLGDKADERAQWLSMSEGLDVTQRRQLQNLYVLAKDTTGFDLESFKALKAAHSGLSETEILQQMALDATEKRIAPGNDTDVVMQLAKWSETDARQFLRDNNLIGSDSAGVISVNSQQFEQFIHSCDGMDRVRLAAAMVKLSPDAYYRISNDLDTDSSTTLKTFTDNVELQRANKKGAMLGTVDNFGSALDIFETLNSVRQLVASWDQMSTTDKGLTMTELVGGVAMSPLSSAVSKALSAAGKALGAASKFSKAATVVKAGVLDVALAPVTFASIGMQWESFWSGNGDTNSFEYKSLVANTVLTTVTTAASLALTGVSIAASLSSAVAASVLGTIAASAGPIGVAIAAAGFIINGVVQGALQLAEFGDYFSSTADKVAQFFASWVGVETDALKRARVEKAATEDADSLHATLNNEWAETKTYLSDLFSKDGYKYLQIRDRDNKVAHGTFKWGGDYAYVLQKQVEYKGVETVVSNHLTNGDTVWAELGNANPDYQAHGSAGKRNLFNLSGAVLAAANGADKADAFNLSAMTEIGAVDGQDGQDSLLLDAGGLAVTLAPGQGTQSVLSYAGKLVILDQLVHRSGDRGANHSSSENVTRNVDQSVNVNGIESYIIENVGSADIKGTQQDEFFDVSGSNVQISGGGGRNTYSLNHGNRIVSTSDDTALWNGEVNAEITLQGISGKVAQTLMVSLSSRYDDIHIRRNGNHLELVDTGRTLTIKGVYKSDGSLDTSKVIQLLDPYGYSFSLPGLGLIDGHAKSLTQVAKTFVFDENTASDLRYVTNDKAVNTYTLQQGAGVFVAEAHTNQLMQFVLEAPLSSLHYGIVDDTLVIQSTDPHSQLELQIRDYANASQSGVVQLWLSPPQGAEQGQQIVSIALPEAGGDKQGRLTPVDTDAVEKQVKQAGGELKHSQTQDSVTQLDLSQVENTVTVEAAKLAEHQQSISLFLPSDALADKLVQVRVADDLILYYADKAQVGLANTPHLNIKGYFSHAVDVKLTHNGGQNNVTISPSQYLGNIGDNQLSGAQASELAGLDGHDHYAIPVRSSDKIRWVINNVAADQKLDTLDLGSGVTVNQLAFVRQGDDLEIQISGQPTKTVMLQNYVADVRAQHLQLKLGETVMRLPAVDPVSGYFVHSQDSDVGILGDGTHILRSEAQGGSKQTLHLSGPVDGYQQEVQGLDLKLSKGDQTLFVRDYYRKPDSVRFAWQGGSHDEVLIPTGYHQAEQALFTELNVERRDWVAYIQNGVTSREQVTSLLVLGQERGSEASDFYTMPDSTDFTVYVKHYPANYNVGERALFSTGYRGQNGFKFYLDDEGYLCYKSYTREGYYNGVEQTIYTQTPRISGRPVSQPNDEIVMKFEGNHTLTVIAKGWGGKRVTTINLNDYGSSRIRFGSTRYLNDRVYSNGYRERRITEGLASDRQIDSIFQTDGQTWGARDSDVATYLQVKGFSAQGAQTLIDEGLTSLGQLERAVSVLKAANGKLSESFIAAYVKSGQSWLYKETSIAYAVALENMGRTPQFIFDAHRYGLSVQNVEAYSKVEKQYPGEDRLADFALALRGDDNAFFMQDRASTGTLTHSQTQLLDSLLTTLEIPEWDRERIRHTIAGNAPEERFDELARRMYQSYPTEREKELNLYNWLGNALGGDFRQKHTFEPSLPNDVNLLTQALIQKGFLAKRASELAWKLSELGVLDYERLDSLMKVGISDNSQLLRLLEANVNGEDILAANAHREQYESGARGNLIQVSTSGILSSYSHVEQTVYYAKEYLGIDGDGNVTRLGTSPSSGTLAGYEQVINPGPVLGSGGGSPTPIQIAQGQIDGVVKLWEQGYIDRSVRQVPSEQSWFGRSNPSNLVDGSDRAGEAFAWRAASNEVDDNIYDVVMQAPDLTNPNTDDRAAFIRFDMKHKVALSSLTLRTAHAVADADQPDTTRSGSYRVEALDARGQWISVSSPLVWSGQQDDMTVAIDTRGVPYQSYRLRGISGSYDRDRWIKEVDFTTVAIERESAAVASIAVEPPKEGDMVPAARVEIAIENASFDSKEIPKNTLVRDVPGWTLAGYNTAMLREGSYISAVDGSNFMQISWSGSSISQELSDTFDATADYQLAMDLGNSQYGNSVSGFEIRLWAGDTLLGNAALSANQARESLGYGRWNTLTLNVDGQVHQQASGKNLKVEVLNTGDENRDIVFVDKIRLAKLTGAMATFGDDPGSIDSRTSEGRYTIQPVLAPTVS